MYDLVIIGSGPAGLSAAVYAKRACLDVVVLEKEPMGGGQMIYTQEVDNYLGLPETNGFDLAQKFEQHAKALEVPFISDEVDNVEKIQTERGKSPVLPELFMRQKQYCWQPEPDTGNSGCREKKHWQEPGCLTVQPVMELFSVTRQWRLSAVEMWHWKMPCIWQPDVKKCI